MKRTPVAVALVICAFFALVTAGCGSGSSSSGTDTAKLAPASSFLYGEVTLDPTGSQEAGVRSILGDLPGSGPPEQRLENLLEQATQSDKTSKVDFKTDVKPWLGDKAAVFVAGPVSSSSAAWAVTVATTDEGAAKDTIKKDSDSKTVQSSYRGVDYSIDKGNGGDAMAVVDGFFVAGSERGVKAAIDASKGESLSSSDRYKEAVKDAKTERIALVYVDLSGILQSVAGLGGDSLGPVAPLLGRLAGGNPVVATISAEQQALVIDGSLIPSGVLGSLFGSSTSLVGDVPGDSWLALGQADFGKSIKSVIGLFAGALGGEQALSDQVRQATGLDLDRDILSWIGDTAFFVSGDSKDTIGGGVLIQSNDAIASKAALTKLAALAAKQGSGATVSAAKVGGAQGFKIDDPSVPKGIYLLQDGDKVVITYGEAAAQAALGAGSSATLRDAPGFTKAASALGEAYVPSLYVSVPPILNLVESFGAGGADYSKAKPYVSILDYLISGSAKTDAKVASRTRIGFKPHD